jgi:hypothetical protein
MTTTYKIKDWDSLFEIAQSRKCERLHWVAVPNKHDGKGYRRVARHEKCCELFAAWNLILQVASKMKTRGLLVDTDGPLTAEDLADKTGYPEAIFVLAFKVLSSPKISWLEKVNGVPSTKNTDNEPKW